VVPAPSVAISGHTPKVERDLKSPWMKDVKLETPLNIATIGVFYEKAAKNVADAYWPMTLRALQSKNAKIGSILGPVLLDHCKSIDQYMDQLRRHSAAGPLTCYIFFLSGDRIYAGLKERLTGEKRIVTQFVQAQNRRGDLGNVASMSIISHNIALQILCKLGACPWYVCYAFVLITDLPLNTRYYSLILCILYDNTTMLTA
jgi:hypothetical protein